MRLKPDVIVADVTVAIRAAKQATSSIPIVMATSADAVGSGLVASLRRPGGNVTIARHHFGAALALAEPLGMRPLIARCLLGLGRLEHRLGHADEARGYLHAAAVLLETMHMKYWLDRLGLDQVGPTY